MIYLRSMFDELFKQITGWVFLITILVIAAMIGWSVFVDHNLEISQAKYERLSKIDAATSRGVRTMIRDSMSDGWISQIEYYSILMSHEAWQVDTIKRGLK